MVEGVAFGTSKWDNLYAITTDAQGRILAVGDSSVGRTGDYIRDAIVIRLNPDGSLDTSFGTGGRVTHAGAAGGVNTLDVASAVAIDSQGRIVVAGSSISQGTSMGIDTTKFDMVVWRFLEDGSLDPSFNSSGFVTHDGAAGGSGADGAQAVSIDSQGRVVVAGYSASPLRSGQTVQDRQATVWRS